MKLGVIGGAGLLGSTSAYLAGMKGYLDEIKLVDIKENLAKCHVMDMGQAFNTFIHHLSNFTLREPDSRKTSIPSPSTRPIGMRLLLAEPLL